ncbi:hypothetical protein CL620_01295 [archaeon]|nr:hypothetical protein [archaeon]
MFVVKDIQPGEKFTSENVRVIRPADGLEPRFYDDVLSATTTCFLERGTPLAKKHVSLFASDQPDEDCSLSLESIIPFTTINTSTTLIPATVDDAKFVYDIRNGDDVRSVSLTTQVIPYESHISFFATHFMQYAIVFFHDFRAGYVRKELSGSLSIALHPEFRGKGIGSAILSHLSGNAIIKTENDASLQAFRKAGWQIIGHYLEKK